MLSLSAIIDEDILRYARVKKKAYIRMHTNYGSLNLELHSDMVSSNIEYLNMVSI